MTEPGGPLRVAVVGLGWIGEAHLADLAVRPDVRVAAVCDVDADRVGRFGVPGYTNPEAMLAEVDLDAVWICTPPRHHLAPTLAAVRAGLAVYLEKPIARDVADAERIAAEVTAAGVVCAVGYQWHAVDLLERMRTELAGQRIGFLLGRSIGPTAARPWFLDRAEGGGNVLERGSHHIDLVRAIAGDVVAVSATASSVRLDRTAERDIEDAITLVLRLADGGTATIAVAWTADGMPGSYSMEVVAGRAVLRLDLDPTFRLTGRAGDHEVDATASVAPFSGSITRFLAAVRVRDPAAVACTPADALATLRVALAAERALATGREVAVA